MKKLLYLVLCLVLVLSLLAFASCGGEESGDKSKVDKSEETESSQDKNDDTTGSKPDGTVDGGTVSSMPDETVDSGAVSSKPDGTVDSGAVSSKPDGTVDSTITSNSGIENDKPDVGGDDTTEKVTIKFNCLSGTLVSGEKEVKINKGSVLLREQMPVYERNGYVICWSYDMHGESPWAYGDIFDEDDTLFATWKKEDSFDGLKVLLSTLKNFQMNTETTVQGQGVSQTSVSKNDGNNVYSEIVAGGMKEQMWYIDGMFYSVYGDQKIKSPVSKEEFEKTYGGAVVAENEVFGIKSEHISSITKDGNVYTVVVDAGKYTDSIKDQVPVELVYSKIVYEFEFDALGLLKKVNAEIAHSSDGIPMELLSVSTITNVGTTVVEAPENIDEFVKR